MEKASANTLSSSFSLADLVGFLFLHTILNWVIRLQKFCLRFLSFFQSHVEFSASSSKIPGERTKNTSSQAREETKLSKGDVEIVMGMMGLSCSQEGGQLKEYLGLDELSTMFEDKEPSLDEVKEAFGLFDENCDGFIDAMELQRVLSKLGFREGLDLSACAEMIAVYDENRDGRIDFNEFIKFMESIFC